MRNFPITGQKNIEFGLGGPFNWARRSVLIEALRKTTQEGHHTILKAVVEKRDKGQRAGVTKGKNKETKDSSCNLQCLRVDERLGERL